MKLKKLMVASLIGLSSVLAFTAVQPTATVSAAYDWSHRVSLTAYSSSYYKQRVALNKKAHKQSFSEYSYKRQPLSFGEKKVLLDNGRFVSTTTKKPVTYSSKSLGTSNISIKNGYVIFDGKRLNRTLMIKTKAGTNKKVYHLKDGKVFTYVN